MLKNVKFIRSYKKKEYYFIKVETKNNETIDIKYTDKDLCLGWLNYFNNAMSYFNYLEEKQNFSEKSHFSNFMKSIKKMESKVIKLEGNSKTIDTTFNKVLP